jgi:hypothetical protein
MHNLEEPLHKGPNRASCKRLYRDPRLPRGGPPPEPLESSSHCCLIKQLGKLGLSRWGEGRARNVHTRDKGRRRKDTSKVVSKFLRGGHYWGGSCNTLAQRPPEEGRVLITALLKIFILVQSILALFALKQCLQGIGLVP